jgi:hypothetical protein
MELIISSCFITEVLFSALACSCAKIVLVAASIKREVQNLVQGVLK